MHAKYLLPTLLAGVVATSILPPNVSGDLANTQFSVVRRNEPYKEPKPRLPPAEPLPGSRGRPAKRNVDDSHVLEARGGSTTKSKRSPLPRSERFRPEKKEEEGKSPSDEQPPLDRSPPVTVDRHPRVNKFRPQKKKEEEKSPSDEQPPLDRSPPVTVDQRPRGNKFRLNGRGLLPNRKPPKNSKSGESIYDMAARVGGGVRTSPTSSLKTPMSDKGRAQKKAHDRRKGTSKNVSWDERPHYAPEPEPTPEPEPKPETSKTSKTQKFRGLFQSKSKKQPPAN